MDEMCAATRTDADLFTMFRLNPKPIACPLLGPPFTFTYNRGTQECKDPVSHAEGCTDNSTLLFKYQACPDVSASESNSKYFLNIFFKKNLAYAAHQQIIK